MLYFRLFALTLAATAVTGCASVAKTTAKGAGKTAVFATKTTAKTTAKVAGVAVQVPLEDLNLKRTRIPKTLRRTERIYSPGWPESCDALESEIDRLTEALGPDVDDPPLEDDRNIFEKTSDGAGNLTRSGIRSVTRSQIPFRSAVRFATGANRHQVRLREAYLLGIQRRSYLKGMGDALGCEEAGVDRTPEEEDKKRFGIF
ncbi:hypothetical protein [Parvularcula oceani]|uniref:hypothetical protein n=1 Tax=Parvularcula oceani TaxID=1247963 RepID=UPI00068B5625|nr:hypothetical protein [Parvularcula oceani]